MVFIDADKPPYADYLEWSVRLTRPGGLIVADNVIRQGQVLDPENTNEQIVGIRRFNEMLAAHPALSATLLPLVGAKGFDGLALALVTGQGTA
jgi:predicted O-methyltransferase YrrM